jgi:fatty acid desaturase
MSQDRKHDLSADDFPSHWMKPSDLFGWKAVLANALPYLLLLALAPALSRRRAWAPWLLSPLIGLYAYRMTLVMHDCIHRTLFEDAALNERLGVTLGAMTGIDFRRFASQHRRHHRRFGERDDPQGFHYLDIGSRTVCEKIWHLVKPLLGFNLVYALPESFLAPRNLARALRRGEGLLLLGAQLCIVALVSGGGRHLALAILPPVSAATFGLFLSQLRGIAEHATTEEKQAGCVRTHAPHWLDRLLLYDLNFNYHEEHHRYPGIPSRCLPEVHHAVHHGDATLPTSMLQTVAAVVLRDSRRPAANDASS